MPKGNNNQTDNNVQQDNPPVVPMSEDTLPPIVSAADVVNNQPSEPTTGSSAPTDDVVSTPITTTPTLPKKKFAGGKIIATVLGLFLLVGGVGAGLVLVQQDQDIREKAASCSGPEYDECRESSGSKVCACQVCGICTRPDWDTDPGSPDNPVVTPPPSGGGGTDCNRQCGGVGLAFNFCMSETSPLTCNQEALNRGYMVPIGNGCQPGQVCDGTGWICRVGVNGYTGGPCIASNRVPGTNAITSVPSCFCGTIQIDGGPNDGTYQMQCGCGNEPEEPPASTPAPTPAPTPNVTAACQSIKAYDTSWAALTNAQLAQLKVGDTVNFCASGMATSGVFTKARFTINSALQPDVANQRPSSNDYCQRYTIPAGVTSFNVRAELYHSTLGWR